MRHFKVVDSQKNNVSNNLLRECDSCFASCNSNHKLIKSCPKYGTKRRLGKISTNKSTTFLCCDKTKTTKLFKEKIEALSYAFPELIQQKEEFIKKVKNEEQMRIKRLVHNLTSLNAHNIQEVYDLVPQELLASDFTNQLSHIKKQIVSNPELATKMFLRMTKNNIHMKSEFSIFNKMERANPKLEIRKHPIRKVLLNVLHTFFVDLSEKDVYVNVEEFNKSIRIDYETIQVALYHIIENASKYTKPNSKIDISFFDFEEKTSVFFEMISLHIEDDEKDKIFSEGYSGVNAKRTAKNGEGIGMWRAMQMLSLNNANLLVERGSSIEKVFGFDFTTNKFIINFFKN